MESEKVMKISGKKLKDMIFNNILLKIGSVILAVVLWLLVINIDDPQVTATIKGIPVQIVNESAITSNNEVYDVISGDTVDIKVTGPRTIVDSLRRDDFTATADFNDLSKTSAVPIDVNINSSRYESKVTISEKSINTMRLSVRELVEKEYEVEVQCNGNPAYGYVMYQTSASPAKIKIKAPEDSHKVISKVAAYISLMGNETDDFVKEGEIRLESDGKLINLESRHITLGRATVNVSGVVYARKSVDITCIVAEKLSDGRIVTGYSLSADSVDIVGRPETLESIAHIDIPEAMKNVPDGTEANENGEIELQLDLKTLLPEGVYIHGSDGIITLKINVEEEKRRSISIDRDDIGIRKIPDNYDASIADGGNISVVVSGLASKLDELDLEKLAPYVDLTGAREGANTLAVNLILPDGVRQVGEATVTVEVVERSQPTTEGNTTTVPPDNSTEPSQESTTPPPTEENTTPEEPDSTAAPEE